MNHKPTTKYKVEVPQSLHSEFAQEAAKRNLTEQQPNKEVTIRGLRSLYKRLSEFGGAEMLKGKTETASDGSRKLEQAEIAFQKSGYPELVRQSSESRKIAEIRKQLIEQFRKSN